MKNSSSDEQRPEQPDLEVDLEAIQQAARKVVHRSPHRKVGRVNARYFQPEPIEHESNLEKRLIHSCMLCPGLEAIRHQPFKLCLADGRQYTPDFKLTFGSPRVVVETKWSTKVDDYIPIFNEASQYLRAKGYVFYVVTEKNVDLEHRSAAEKYIARYAKSEFPSEVQDRIVRHVEEAGSQRVGDLLDGSVATEEMVLHLLATRRLFLFDYKPVTADSLVAAHPRKTGVEAFEARLGIEPWSLRAPVPITKERRSRIPKRKLPGLPYTLTARARQALNDAETAQPPSSNIPVERIFASRLAQGVLEKLSVQPEGSAS